MDIDAQKMSLTPLMVAARDGDLEGVRWNLGETRRQDKNGWTALMWAAGNGRLECAKLLLSEVGMKTTWYGEITLNGTTFIFNSGTTALTVAARRGQSSIIPLLEKEIGMRDEDGCTALMWAAYCGRTDCARLLLSEAGMQTTKKWSPSPPGTTALMLAAYKNHPEVVELLLPYEQGLTDSKGNTAKWHADNGLWRWNRSRVCELLENEGSNRLPPPTEELLLMTSAAAGNVEGVREHLDHAGYRDPTGTTALMLAAKNGHASCIPLLEREYRIQDNNGNTALMCAAGEGQTEAVRLLRPLEARLQDGKGWTALMHAARGGHGDCVKLLLLERDLADMNSELPEDIATRIYEEMDGERKEGYKNVVLSLLKKRPRLPVLPEKLSSYKITGRLGRGAFGTIFSAWSGEHGNFALKIVEYEGMERPIINALRREMDIIPSIEHPHVLHYHWVHDEKISDTAYLAMEWCPGTLLDEVRERTEREESLRNDEIWRYFREMAAGLACLHERGLVHRDLKPANIFLAPDGRAVLADFGLIRDAAWSRQMSTVAGTELYMAPELYESKPQCSFPVDIWALGVVGYELCTGRLPFLRVTAIVGEDPPAIEGRGELADLISRMLSKDPGSRPTARKVLEEAMRHQ